MVKVKDERQYELITQRIEEILRSVSDENPTPEYLLAELEVLGGLAEDFEAEHYPVAPPSLPDVLRHKMGELNLSQTETALHLRRRSPSQPCDTASAPMSFSP